MLLLYVSTEVTPPLLKLVCFVVAWSFVFLLVWSIWTALQDAVNRAAQMHKIPCSNCQFFTENYQLKCTVHPSIALSEAAIGCPDHQTVSDSYISALNDSSNESAHANIPSKL